MEPLTLYTDQAYNRSAFFLINIFLDVNSSFLEENKQQKLSAGNITAIYPYNDSLEIYILSGHAD